MGFIWLNTTLKCRPRINVPTWVTTGLWYHHSQFLYIILLTRIGSLRTVIDLEYGLRTKNRGLGLDPEEVRALGLDLEDHWPLALMPWPLSQSVMCNLLSVMSLGLYFISLYSMELNSLFSGQLLWLYYLWRNHVFKVGGPILWSRLLYRTKYGWYTQLRALQSVT